MADNNIDTGGGILAFHQHGSSEQVCYEKIAIGKALQVRLLSEGHQKALAQTPSHRWVKICVKMTSLCLLLYSV